ncbi:MAG: GtrA family protein [Pseudomonadota bacterium]
MTRRLPISLVRYGIVGVASNVTLYVFFIVLYRLSVPPPAAAAVCYALGLVISYLGNRYWSFESKGSHKSDLPKFLAAYGIGFLATMLFIVVLSWVMRPEIAQILNIGLTALVIYGSLRLLDFGGAKVDVR